MKQLMAILLILGALYVVKQLFLRYDTIKKQDPSAETSSEAPPPGPASAALPGMPASLEDTLQKAEKQGPEALKNFLISYRWTLRDPRLADIELDYVVLVSRHDPTEAKRVFQSVKDRIPKTSPLYPRIKSLERTYQ